MAGTNSTAKRADLFDTLTESGPLELTCMTALSWHQEAEKVDRILWHLADNGCRATTCDAFNLERPLLDEIIRRANEPELSAIG